MKYAKFIRDFYNTIICSLLFLAVTMTILPSYLYAQAETKYHNYPKGWEPNDKLCRKSINKNIRITGVSFEAGPYAITLFGLQPTYSSNLTSAQRNAKLRNTKLSDYGRFGAVFSVGTTPSSEDWRLNWESYMFNLNDIAPFIVSEGVVYRTKRITVNGVRVPDAPLRIEHGSIPEPEFSDYMGKYTDKVMFLNGLSSKHNYRVGLRLWIPDGTFTDWKGSKKKGDSAFLLFKTACLVHYFPVDPSQVRSDGRVLLDKRWVQGYKDYDNRWRFIFVVASGTRK